MSRILVVAAHPDDEVLGVGATIAKKVAEGHIAHALILGEGQTSRYEHRQTVSDNTVDRLHQDSIRAGNEIGYSCIDFSCLPDNRFDEVSLLDIIKKIEAKIELFKPDIIYTHYHGDLNIDHQKTFEAVITATRPLENQSVKEIYAFETLSSTEWNFSGNRTCFSPNVFEIVDGFIEQKCNAMKLYPTELRDFPHPRSLEGIYITAKKWGSVVGAQYVEAFELVRRIV